MAEQRKISKKGLIFITTITSAFGLYLWLDYFYDFTPNDKERVSGRLVSAIIISCCAIIEFLEVLRFGKDRKIYHYVAYILVIPLLPLLIVGVLSQTKLIASLTLPLMVFSIVACASTYSYQQLELLHLGKPFNDNVIPYLNLTTITVVFIYCDKLLVKLLARFIPENQMPQAVKDVTYELLDKRPFVKIAYLILTALFIIATIEKLGEKEFFHFLDPYKNVALQSLVTFAAVDRMISKWKTK